MHVAISLLSLAAGASAFAPGAVLPRTSRSVATTAPSMLIGAR